jgi:putative transposase
LLGQHRSTQRQTPKRDPNQEEEQRLVARMLELVRRHPRFGYRRIWALLRREGWQINRKRVWRLWRHLGLKVPRKQRKKRRLGSSANSCARRPAQHNQDAPIGASSRTTCGLGTSCTTGPPTEGR